MRRQPPALISNEYRTCSLSIPSVERAALGGQHSLGLRYIPGDCYDPEEPEHEGNGRFESTGYYVGGYGIDPLDLLIALEEDL